VVNWRDRHALLKDKSAPEREHMLSFWPDEEAGERDPISQSLPACSARETN